ncbi:MAG: hypothetical protein DMG50_23190 [Acidobacteria bacterium]|nr:MAG: hypothetical protein DMG50_23190 [Acidobacteriota bacterium]
MNRAVGAFRQGSFGESYENASTKSYLQYLARVVCIRPFHLMIAVIIQSVTSKGFLTKNVFEQKL